MPGNMATALAAYMLSEVSEITGAATVDQQALPSWHGRVARVYYELTAEAAGEVEAPQVVDV